MKHQNIHIERGRERERAKERVTDTYARLVNPYMQKAFERESLITEERIFERLFSSLALVLRLRKTLIHDGKDTAKEKADDEGKTPTTTRRRRRRRRRTEDDNKEQEKKEEQKRF